MAIQIYCTQCRSSFDLNTKQCRKCGATLTKKNRKYRVTVSVKGKRETRIVDNLSMAREVEPTLKANVLRGEFDIETPKKAITLKELWTKYLAWAKENKQSWRDDELYYEKHIKPRFAGKPLDAITAIGIERMKSEMKKSLNRYKRPYSAQTIKHQVVIIRRLFNLAAKWGLYDGSNPVKSVTMPKVDNQKTEFLTNDQLKKLLETLEAWPFKESAQLVWFALFTGIRRGEIFKLTWDDVDFERGFVSLRDPKGGKSETIPVSKQAMDVLHSVDVTDSPLVFPGKNGQQRKSFKGPWGRIRKAAGLPPDFRFHGLRHHFASTLVSNGVDLAIVRELLTHKDLTTTQRYAHPAPDVVRRAALKSGELLIPKKADNVLDLKQD